MADRAAAPLRDLLSDKGRALFSGRIDVEIGATVGAIHFAEGQIVDARVGSAVGEPALWRMLLARTPKVGVEAGRPRATEGAVLGLPGPLLERFGEREALLSRYAEKVGGFGAVWSIRFDVLARRLDELPDAINPLIRLLDGRRSVRHVVVEASLDELLTLRILARLLALGVLEVPTNIVVGRLDEETEDLAAQDANDDVDVDGDLEHALRASLGEPIDDPIHETTHEPAHDPIPLHTRKPVEAPAEYRTSETSSPPGPMPAPDAMLDGALPRRAPPLEKGDDLRVWLGNEEAFFEKPAPLATVTPQRAPGPPPLVVPPAILVVSLCVAALLGALFASKCG